MTRQLLNTLYVQSPDAYVRLDHDTLRVEIEGRNYLQVPLQHLGAIVLFGNSMMSPQAMQRCAAEGREITFLDYTGRFRCRVEGPASGNVLLRLAQFTAHGDALRCLEIARRIVAAKIRNSRDTLVRWAREAGEERRLRLQEAAATLAQAVSGLPGATTLDGLRGAEGDAASRYFGVFGMLLSVPTPEFAFVQRTRRPPRDRVNATLSFLYSLLTHDCTSAAQGVGLDPQVGFLHALRPGRPALGLDLAEEFRSGLVDRLVLTLINRRQLRPEHFDVRPEAADSVLLNEQGRRLVLTAYQKRKEEGVRHTLLKETVPLGLVLHLQARLLARHLRGETDAYHPFLFS